MTILRGEAIVGGEPRGAYGPLLYIVTACSDPAARRGRSPTSHRESVSRITNVWKRGTKEISIVCEWNRKEDAIYAGSSRFQRKDGNVVCIIADPRGETAAFQLPSLDDARSEEEATGNATIRGEHPELIRVLKHVKTQGKDLEPIRALKFP